MHLCSQLPRSSPTSLTFHIHRHKDKRNRPSLSDAQTPGLKGPLATALCGVQEEGGRKSLCDCRLLHSSLRFIKSFSRICHHLSTLFHISTGEVYMRQKKKKKKILLEKLCPGAEASVCPALSLQSTIKPRSGEGTQQEDQECRRIKTKSHGTCRSWINSSRCNSRTKENGSPLGEL